MLENYRSPGSRLGKRPFFELGVMLHGQAAFSKCHCFQILRAKRDETIRKMKKRALDNVHVDGTLSPWGPPDYIPLARARPGPRAVTRATFAFRPQIHSWGSYVGKYVRTPRGGVEERKQQIGRRNTPAEYVRKYVRTYVSDAPFAPVGFGPLVSCPSPARAFASPAMGNGRSPSHPL